MISSLVRRTSFWLLDTIRGKPIRTHYDDIKHIMESSIEQQRKTQDEYLAKLLSHATETTGFYRSYSGKELTAFPVITKAIVKDHYGEFLSTTFIGEKLHHMSTSGSTGTPFTVYQDMQKRARVLAELIYFNEVLGQKVGDKFCFFRVWTNKDLATSQNSKIALIAKNEIPVDISCLDDENMERIRQLLRRDRSINEIMGYASTHKRLVQYIEDCGDDPSDYHIKLIVSGSEMLEAGARKRLQQQFGCTVVSRYSNQENGVLAQQCSNSEKYHINSASYVIELLQLESDEPAKPGEIGRVVVTDLFNYAMPLIRYDTGDLAMLGENCTCGWQTSILDNLQGRRVDVCTDPDGKLISPFLLDKFMEQFDQLAQFQFVQEGKDSYVLYINDPRKVYQDEEFAIMLQRLLGARANCRIERVEDIPCMDSGKFKQMICNWQE